MINNNFEVLSKTYSNIPNEASSLGVLRLTTYILKDLDSNNTFKVIGIGGDDWVLKNGFFTKIGE